MNLTFDQIKELHSMGFTPEQITSFTTSPDTIPGDQAGTDSGEGTATSPDPAVIEQPVDKPVETVDNSNEPDTLRELRDEIKGLKASIQAQNVKTQSIEVVNEDDKLEKAMAEFIRPSYKREE